MLREVISVHPLIEGFWSLLILPVDESANNSLSVVSCRNFHAK
jgi:hypothetical protein